MSDDNIYTRRLIERPLILPVLLIVAAVFLMVALQCVELVREHGSLETVHAQQDATVQEATKLRQQLSALAGETAQLAANGDTAAKDVVEQMRRQGFTLALPKP